MPHRRYYHNTHKKSEVNRYKSGNLARNQDISYTRNPNPSHTYHIYIRNLQPNPLVLLVTFSLCAYPIQKSSHGQKHHIHTRSGSSTRNPKFSCYSSIVIQRSSLGNNRNTTNIRSLEIQLPRNSRLIR